MCVLFDGKWISLRLSLLSSYHPDLLVRDDPREKKNHFSFVGSCLVSTVSRHVRSTQKEHIHNHMECEIYRGTVHLSVN